MYTELVRKNVTFSADSDLLQLARERAAAQKTTLQREFQAWLEQYARRRASARDYPALMARLSHIRAGGPYTRDELNER